MANERLRGAIIERGLTLDQVAEELGVSAKTVERWISDPNRKPYRRFQYATASLLQCEVSYLWSEERTSAEVTEAGNAELIKLYPHRSVVPNHLWPQLYAKAKRHFEVLVYSGFWLTEDSAFHRVVKEKSASVSCSEIRTAPLLRCGAQTRG
jgi:transcriptional regulator with XRE-family HTH domain